MECCAYNHFNYFLGTDPVDSFATTAGAGRTTTQELTTRAKTTTQETTQETTLSPTSFKPNTIRQTTDSLTTNAPTVQQNIHTASPTTRGDSTGQTETQTTAPPGVDPLSGGSSVPSATPSGNNNQNYCVIRKRPDGYKMYCP